MSCPPVRSAGLRPDRFAVVAGRGLVPGRDPAHDPFGLALPASQRHPPRRRLPSGAGACLPLLGLAHDRDGDQGVGRDPSQAPRPLRNRRRSAQPGGVRHRQDPVARGRALPGRLQGPGDGGAVRRRHGRRLDGAQSLRALVLAGPDPDAVHRPGPVRRGRPGGLGAADAVDPGHCGGRHQRPRPLVGLPQLRDRRSRHQPGAVGHRHRRRGTAQQPPCLPQFGQVRPAQVGVRRRLGDAAAVRVRGPGQGHPRGALAGGAAQHRPARCRYRARGARAPASTS